MDDARQVSRWRRAAAIGTLLVLWAVVGLATTWLLAIYEIRLLVGALVATAAVWWIGQEI